MSRRLESHTRSGLTLSQSQTVGTDPHWIPNTDIYDSEDGSKIYVVMELAGMSAAGIEIRIKGRVLTVHGERPDASRKKKHEFQQMEIDYGHFERRLRVACPVVADRATARYSNGFLLITLPKAGPEQPKTDVDEVSGITVSDG
jgi:HSP20 family protein